VELIPPFALFAAFLLFFAFQARREGKSMQAWLAERNAATTYSPGWWKPAAALIALMVLAFVVYLTATQGFRWKYLLVIPLFVGFFTISAAALSWLFRSRFPRR
jgi:hypothetical protein